MKIPYNKQYIDKQDLKYVQQALKGDLITTGPWVNKFENNIKKFIRSKYTLSCSSGTSAIHLALISIGVKKGDNFVVPSINFVASTNILKELGANIFLADTEDNGQMSPRTLRECIKKNNLKKIKGFFTMYLGGFPLYIPEFYNLKKKYKCFLIEDACHALGAHYKILKKFYPVGSCIHSDIAIFSFHAIKSITTGEGGLLATNNLEFYKKAKLCRSHGIVRKNSWDYDCDIVGYNYRLSDINAALGLAQLKKLKKFMDIRKNIFQFYIKNLNKSKNFNIIYNSYKNIISANHLFIIFLKNKKNRDRLLKILQKNNIQGNINYKPIYEFKIHKKLKRGFKYTGSKNYFERCISLPIFCNLKKIDQKKIVKIVNNYKFI